MTFLEFSASGTVMVDVGLDRPTDNFIFLVLNNIPRKRKKSYAFQVACEV
jgi:hypothetical protein